MAKRKLEDWITSFYSFTDTLPTPQLFRKWAGIVTIAGALEQKVWIHAYGESIYGNMFVLLVGPPGVGKGVVTSRIWNLWASLSEDGQYVAPTSMTKASLIDSLRDAERKVVRPLEDPPVVSFNSLKICSREFHSLMPTYDSDFMGALTDIYDCKEYSERRRTHSTDFKIESPQISLLASTTPSFLTDLLPEGAWDQGFMSRTILVYSTERVKRPLFAMNSTDLKLYNHLRSDLHIIGNLFGAFKFTSDAADYVVAWDLDDGPPRPGHPKLTNYNSRRTAHLLKLCMVSCVSNSDTLEITLDHVNTALEWLLEVENHMADIFKAMASGGDAKVMEDAHYYLYQIWLKDKTKSIPESTIIRYLQERVPAMHVPLIFKVMVGAGILIKQIDGYKPKPRRV